MGLGDLPFVRVQVLLEQVETGKESLYVEYCGIVEVAYAESLAFEKGDSRSQGNIRRFSIERRPLHMQVSKSFLHLDYQVALQALEQRVVKSMSIVWGLIQRKQMS